MNVKSLVQTKVFTKNREVKAFSPVNACITILTENAVCLTCFPVIPHIVLTYNDIFCACEPQIVLRYKLLQHLISPCGGRFRLIITPFTEELCELAEECKGTLPILFHILERVDELSRIIIIFQNIADSSKLIKLRIRNPLR